MLALVAAAVSCSQQPLVRLGNGIDRDAGFDEDGSVDEAMREATFRALAEKECRENEPVCGSDGRTYRNICHALGAGIEVFRSGPC